MAAIRRLGRALLTTLGIVASGMILAAFTLVSVSTAGATPAAPPRANPPSVNAAAIPAQNATTPPPVTNPNTDETFADGLSFDDCVGQAVQLPGCGTVPTQAGDRGGWLQTTVFFAMTGGMVLIALRIARSIRKRDHVLND